MLRILATGTTLLDSNKKQSEGRVHENLKHKSRDSVFRLISTDSFVSSVFILRRMFIFLLSANYQLSR